MILYEPTPADGGFVPPKSTAPRALKVDMPHEPPAEVLKVDFKIDNDDPMFKHDSSESRVTIEDKQGKVTPAKEVETKVETKAEEKKEEVQKKVVGLKPPSAPKEEKKEEKKEEEVKQIVPPSKDAKVVRDYSGYSEEEVSHFKQMSDAAYKWTSEQLKTKKQQEGNTFLQHPDAYTLAPKFQELRAKVTFASKEAEYWKSCLAQLDLGNPIKDLVGFDNNGNLQLGNEYKPSKELEENVRMVMQKAYGTAQTFAAELQEFPTKFKSNVTNDLQAIESERKKRFAWASDPKFLDYTLDMGQQGEMTVKAIRQSIIDLFPPYLRNSPSTEVCADLFVALRIQDAELREAKSGKNIVAQEKADEERAEPSSEVKPAKAANSVNGVKEFSLSGMPS